MGGESDNQSVNIYRPRLMRRQTSATTTASRPTTLGSNRRKKPKSPNAHLQKILESTKGAKLKSILDDDFDEANRLEKAESDLKKTMDQITEANFQRDNAISERNYDRARDLSLNIKSYRSAALRKAKSLGITHQPEAQSSPSSDDFSDVPSIEIFRPGGVQEQQSNDENLSYRSRNLPSTNGNHFSPLPSAASNHRRHLSEDDFPIYRINMTQESERNFLPNSTASLLEESQSSVSRRFPLSERLSRDATLASLLSSTNLSLPMSRNNTTLSGKSSLIRSSQFFDDDSILDFPQSPTNSHGTIYNFNYSLSRSLLSSADSCMSGPNCMFKFKSRKLLSPLSRTLSDLTMSDNYNSHRYSRSRRLEQKSYDKEDEVIPTVRKRNQIDIWSADEADIFREDQVLDQINPSERAYARKAMSVFDLVTVANIYSKNYEDRSEALSQMEEKMKHAKDQIQARNLLEMAIPALVRALNDKLFNGYAPGIDFLKYIVTEFLHKYDLVSSEGPKVVNNTFQILLDRTGDTVNDHRFAELTYEATDEIFKSNIQMGNYYLQKFMQPFYIVAPIKVDQGKARIVWNGVNTLWDSGASAVSTRKVCTFAVDCLQHSDPEVKNIGKELVLFLYERGERATIRQLLPRGSALLHSHTLRSLYSHLDQIDESNGAGESMKQKSGGDIASKQEQNSQVNDRTTNSAKNKNVRLAVDKSKKSRDSVDYSKVCMHCGQLPEEGLEKHRKEHCLMLMHCQACGEVVETRHYRDHALYDCKHKSDFKVCDRCHQSIQKDQFARHRKSNKCKISLPDLIAGRCICGEDVRPNNDIGWRKHLMHSCKANVRRQK
ncbi:centrosomal protein [Ditylenchus destructor]|nr:centrosomal protein [Ditylenchus destructor]